MEEDKLSDCFVSIYEGMNQIKVQMKVMEKQVRCLEKSMEKEIKNKIKNAEKKKKNRKAKEPSGFAKPAPVTNELCIFLNKEEGTQIARTECTKAIIDYIHKNNLQFGENKQIIKPDEKLKTLLGLTDEDELTYFTLQKYMNKHFFKMEKAVELSNE
jgi:chromatin remodeling complex protein RSC6